MAITVSFWTRRTVNTEAHKFPWRENYAYRCQEYGAWSGPNVKGWAMQWLRLLLLGCLQTTLVQIARASLYTAYTDTNPVINPCTQLMPLAQGDAISIAVALGGSRTLWYNQSDPTQNLLSPCSPSIIAQVPQGAQVAVFRPMVDQLSLLQIQNDSLLAIASTFSGEASLIVYAGYNSTYDNSTIVSSPRTISTPVGNSDGGTGYSRRFATCHELCYRHDDNCASCGNSSALCMNNNCATDINTCSASNDTTLCLTRINVAYSGTDRNSLSFMSWMNVENVGKYSLSSLYNKAGSILQQGVTSIVGNGNNVGTGGTP